MHVSVLRRRCRSRHLPPVVDREYVGAIETRRVGALHRHALDDRAEAARKQCAIGWLARRIDTGHELLRAPRRGEAFAETEETDEIIRATRTRAHGAELDVAHVAAGLGSGTDMADGESPQLAV